MRRKRAFCPTLDGIKLEDRLVLSTARVTAAAVQTAIPVLTTRTYNQVLNNIHNALLSFERTAGTQADFNRLNSQVTQQLHRGIPFAIQNGLVDAVQTILLTTTPQTARADYTTIHDTIRTFVNDETTARIIHIGKSAGHFWSDNEILFPTGTGTVAAAATTGTGTGTVAAAAATTHVALPALTTRTYNEVLTNIHNALIRFERSAGTQAELNRLVSDVTRQVHRIPFSNRDGLTTAVQDFVVGTTPQTARADYTTIHDGIRTFVTDEVNSGIFVVKKSFGNTWSDHEIPVSSHV
jgi:hypothetical protein